MLSRDDYDYQSGASIRGGDWGEDAPASPPLTFFGITRGVCRFGVLLSGSLALTLLFRLQSSIAVVGWLILGCSIAAVILFCTFSKDDRLKVTVLTIAGMLLIGVLFGTWDAIHSLFGNAPLALQVLTVLMSLAVVVGLDALRRGGRNAE